MDPAKRRENVKKTLISLKSLLEPGLLGRYTWFEAVEVIAFGSAGRDEKKTPYNVFSIYVAEDGEMPSITKQIFLDKKSKKLRGLDGWSFRVTKRPVNIDELLKSLESYGRIGTWAPPGQPPLEVGNLVGAPAVFCPPDSRTEVPLNAVLKNNFWSGSYVIELKDDDKSALGDLARKDAVFGELSEWLLTRLPLNLSRVPDRIGDVLFQIPSKALVVKFRRRVDTAVEFFLGWNPDVAARPIVGEYRIEQDGLISCLSRFDLAEGACAVDIPQTSGDLQFSVWDKERRLLLAATTTIHSHGGKWRVESYTSSGMESPRRFKFTGPGGTSESHEIALMEPSGGWRRHQQPRRPEEVDWRARRELKANMKQLVMSRRFLQYGYNGTTRQDEQRRALEDLRILIRTVSQGAIYLWDPYLSANDVLNTLAFCPDAGTELWGLTSSKPSKMGRFEAEQEGAAANEVDSEDTTEREKWISAQRDALDEAFSGPPSMKLEFRMSWGIQGGFHDRFLIFPGLGRSRTRVWSLGASINHIGSQHCIVQEVSYPESVLEAFQVFWKQSNQPEHLIWKYS